MKLKLIKGLSYTGYGVTVQSKTPYIEVKDKKTADALIATKRFSLTNESDNGNGNTSES